MMRCLAKDPAQRFATALEFRAALNAVTFFAGEPVKGKPGVSPTLLVVALGLVLGLLLGFALA